jgi:hypothetical protein
MESPGPDTGGRTGTALPDAAKSDITMISA